MSGLKVQPPRMTSPQSHQELKLVPGAKATRLCRGRAKLTMILLLLLSVGTQTKGGCTERSNYNEFPLKIACFTDDPSSATCGR
jgi:hypothetical protein